MNKYNKKLRYNSTIRNIVNNVILFIILRLKARSALI
jgi:hypothetical protein